MQTTDLDPKNFLKLIFTVVLFVILLPFSIGAEAADVIIEPVFNQTEARSMLDSINHTRRDILSLF